MPVVPGWRHFSSGEAGSSKARGSREAGEAVEGGSPGPVDGQPQGARLGEAGEMPHADLIGRRRRRGWKLGFVIMWICYQGVIRICNL